MIDKVLVIRITTKIKDGTGFCTIETKDSKKVYHKQGPVHSIISDDQCARMLFIDVARELFDAEIKGR